MGRKCCGGGCVDTNTDPMHCGSCGTACATGQICVLGVCTAVDAGVMCGTAADCMASQLCCGGRCVASDRKNCGVCGTVCSAGTQDCCSDRCVDLSDDRNCGKCGNVCVSPDGGMSCKCATTSPAGTYECLLNGSACQ
jgi:hypothetical protein